MRVRVRVRMRVRVVRGQRRGGNTQSVVKCSNGSGGEARRSIGSTLGDAHAKTWLGLGSG